MLSFLKVHFNFFLLKCLKGLNNPPIKPFPISPSKLGFYEVLLKHDTEDESVTLTAKAKLKSNVSELQTSEKLQGIT